MPSTNVNPQPATQPVPQAQAAVEPPKPIVTLGTLYKEYRDADVAANRKFAKVCRHCKIHETITPAALRTILEESGLSEDSAKVESTRILNFRDPENESVLRDMEEGKITINEARIMSTKKAVSIRVAAAKGEAAPKSGAGRKERSPEDKMKDALAGACSIALDNSVPLETLQTWLEASFRAVQEKHLQDEAEKAKKAAEVAAQTPSPAPSPEATLVEAIQAKPVAKKASK